MDDTWFDMTDNWYIILDLEFDPPIEDEQVIAEKIEERAKFWSVNFNNFKLGAQYRTWHQNIPQMKKDMIGSANIRKQLAEDACVSVYAPVDKLLKTIGRKGSISVEEGDRLAKHQKISIEVVKRRAVKLGIKWDDEESTKDFQSIYDKHYKNKPTNYDQFEQMKQLLSTFNVSNLYEFLFMNTPTKNPRNTPIDKLTEKAHERKLKDFYKNDSISGTGSKLCGHCELVFKDESSKEIYDTYLDFSKRKAILDSVKSNAQILGQMTEELEDESIGLLTQVFKDRKLSEDVLLAFCRVEKIAYNPKGKEKAKAVIKVCRCGFINDVTDGRVVCGSCGLDLNLSCPKCGKENDANIKVCSCGFKFENIDKALVLCDLADQAIRILDFKTANALILDASKYWQNSSVIKSARERLQDFEQRVSNELFKMNHAMKEKRFIEAEKQYKAIKKIFPEYFDSKIEDEIEQAIRSAKTLLTKANSAKDKKEILNFCVQAFEQCSDLPGVRELVPVPEQVRGLKIEAISKARVNRISWMTDSDLSVKYVVVRSDKGWIQRVNDGDIIFRGIASIYSDSDFEPGVMYYYNVFSERAGVYSSGAQGEIKSVINFFEVSNISVTAADSSLNIMWDAIPKNATAEIFEVSDSKEGKFLGSTGSDSFLISNLRNEHQYRFRIVLSYIVNGEKKYSNGVLMDGIPTCPPQPIDSLRVKHYQNDTYEAIWYQDSEHDVRLFCSQSKPQLNSGDLVSVSNLERSLKPVQQLPVSSKTNQGLRQNMRGASFVYSGNEHLYIVPVIVKSGSAVVGSWARVSKREAVNIKSVKPVNGKINIYIDTPNSATGFVVLYSHERFVSDISEIKSIRKYIPIKQYQLNSSIILDTLEPKKYFLTVFAEFNVDGEKDYSSGSDFLFDNEPKEIIEYSISTIKIPLGNNVLVLEFETENKAFDLPEIDVMSAIGNTPIFKSSAKLFHTIPAQRVNGKLQVKIPIPKGMPKDTYVKAFLNDDKSQGTSQLRLKLKSNHKIS